VISAQLAARQRQRSTAPPVGPGHFAQWRVLRQGLAVSPAAWVAATVVGALAAWTAPPCAARLAVGGRERGRVGVRTAADVLAPSLLPATSSAIALGVGFGIGALVAGAVAGGPRRHAGQPARWMWC
jgi:hypothetical protein